MLESHPCFKINPEHDVLYVNMLGTWNAETTHKYAEQYKKVVSRYFARAWASILDLRELEMLVSEDDQEELLIALNTWSFIKGMSDMAIIVSEHNRGHFLFQFEEIFAKSPAFKREVFSNPVQARAWLSDEGFRGRELINQPVVQAISG